MRKPFSKDAPSPRRPRREEDRDTPDDKKPRAKLRRDKPGMAARGAALDVLRLIGRGASLDEGLARCRTFGELEGADRAFTRHLVTVCLRRQGSLDEVIDTYLSTPLKPAQVELRSLLRLAAAQILLLDTPAHAVGSTSTELAKERRETAGFAKLVNALCRRMAETGAERLAEVSPRADTPGWLWRRWERAYGPRTARAIAAAHRVEPPLDVTTRPGERDRWAEPLEASVVGPTSLRRAPGAGRIDELPGYADGAWWIQDVAATLPAALAGDIAGKSVIDLCAAPGGKTLQLASAGARVTAVDISPHRTETLKANLARTGFDETVEVVTADVLDWRPAVLAPLVLLDAPCTATGTIRRHPDLLWNKDERDVAALVTLQDRMIDRALEFLTPGGVLIFATCSLLPEEGEARVEAALARHEGLKRLPVSEDEVGGLPVINKHGDVRCLPHQLADGGMDGFFAARLQVPG